MRAPPAATRLTSLPATQNSPACNRSSNSNGKPQHGPQNNPAAAAQTTRPVSTNGAQHGGRASRRAKRLAGGLICAGMRVGTAIHMPNRTACSTKHAQVH